MLLYEGGAGVVGAEIMSPSSPHPRPRNMESADPQVRRVEKRGNVPEETVAWEAQESVPGGWGLGYSTSYHGSTGLLVPLHYY